MKKSYVYFIAPVVGVAIFGAVYWKYAAGYEAKIEAMAKKQADERKAKIDKDNEAKRAAVEAAVASQEKRKKEKAEKDARDAKEKEDREQAVQVRNKTQEDSRKFQETVSRLKREVELNKKEIAAIAEDKKRSLDEQAFLREYVKKAETNTAQLRGVLEKIEAADKAAADAAKAAAAAKKKE